MTDQLFPTGKFTYTVGEASPVVEIDGQGKMTLTLDGEVIVVAKYQVTGDTFEVEDVAGAYANPEYGVGRYTWNLKEETLTFTLIEDKNPPRPQALAVPWHRVQ